MQETKRQYSRRSNREANMLQRETRKVKSLTKSYMNEMSKRETACDLLQASRVKERETSNILAISHTKNADLTKRLQNLEEECDDEVEVCMHV